MKYLALALIAILAAACSVIYVSDAKNRNNPACLLGCEVNETAPASSAPAK